MPPKALKRSDQSCNAAFLGFLSHTWQQSLAVKPKLSPSVRHKSVHSPIRHVPLNVLHPHHTQTMRAFMRAIGLGGLFRRSAAETTLNTANSFRVITLEQFESMTTVDNSAAFEAHRISRHSSVNERPQFLFFCGSDTSAFPSGELSPCNGSTLASRLATMHSPTPVQPAIDHHMPVFFMPKLSSTRPTIGGEFAGC